jgi:hypothetical protein
MNQLPISLTDGALHIDNSSLERFVTCPRSGQYYFIHRREKSAPRPSLDFGRIIHSALEVRYQNLDLPAQTVLPMMLDKLAAEFEHYTPPEGDFRNYQLACEIIIKYMDKYPIEDFTLVKLNDNKPLIETSFAVPLGLVEVQPGLLNVVEKTTGEEYVYKDAYLPIVWTGRIDLGYRRENKLHLMDHKTTSVMGSTYWMSFDLSHATYGYSWAMKQLTGETPFGYVINGISINKPTKTGKSNRPDEWFERKSVVISPEHLEEWVEDTLHIVTNVLQQATYGYFPKHTAWCVGKFGACPYMDVCLMPPDSREVVLYSNNYKDVTWSPHNNE